MSEVKHTPGKLVALGRNIRTDTQGQLLPYIVAHTGVYTLTGDDLPEVPEANANRLALAWNCHDDLLAACRLATPLLVLLEDIARNPAMIAGVGVADAAKTVNEVIVAIRNAVAKAEGRHP